VEPRAVVEQFVVAFGEGRLQDAWWLLHDEFVVHAAGDVPYSGDYVGAHGSRRGCQVHQRGIRSVQPRPDRRRTGDVVRGAELDRLSQRRMGGAAQRTGVVFFGQGVDGVLVFFTDNTPQRVTRSARSVSTAVSASWSSIR
jgi:hypothetical protein